MEIDDLKGLIEMLKETDITELQVEKDGIKVKIKRDKLVSAIDLSKAHVVSEKSPSQPAAIVEDTQRLMTVTAPIVGTFYRAATPEAVPFVEVGAKVKKGQVLCIIEAMKLMNEIESEVDGVVVRSLVENGHSVEYGEPLFMIEPV